MLNSAENVIIPADKYENANSIFMIGSLLNQWDQAPGYKTFSCSTQPSMKLSLLINMKMPTNVGIFIIYMLRKFHTQLT